eukprot:3303817-Prymnesium_polylepis.1
MAKSIDLQCLLQCGPGHRLRPIQAFEVSNELRKTKPDLNESGLLLYTMVEQALDGFTEKCTEVLGICQVEFMGWKETILEKVEARLGDLTPAECEDVQKWRPDMVGWSQEVQQEVDHLRKMFVIAPADKETGALVFTCRKHWEDKLFKE